MIILKKKKQPVEYEHMPFHLSGHLISDIVEELNHI